MAVESLPFRLESIRRRNFLAAIGAASISFTLFDARGFAARKSGRSLRGIFPIAQTPFTESNKLDIDSLAEQVRFIDRGRVHGFVWPQLASEWSTLTESERIRGAEAIMSAGANLRPAIVIGVQAPDIHTAVRYAKHAEQGGADAIISLPPSQEKDPHAIIDYYEQVGEATGLPLFVQAVGNMSVDSIIDMYKAIPTLRYVKDEAGQPLMRIAELRSRSSDQLKVFTGGHGRTLIDEMIRGFSGSMPAASFADVYASAWDLWHEGKHEEAVRTFGNAALLINEIGAYGLESMKYILCLRGVFKTYRTREAAQSSAPSGVSLASGSVASRASLDEEAKRVLREILDLMKPSLRA
jgi:dihydrodipicolinate synthase/N-acetylneuraminate lyase